MSILALPELLTKAEVAPLLRVKPKTVERLIQRGELTPTPIGRKVLVRRDVLAAYIEKMTRPTCPKGSSSIEGTGSPSDQTADPPTFIEPGTRSAAAIDRRAEHLSALRTLRKPKTA